MKFPEIGTLYIFVSEDRKRLLFAVIENNYNDYTTTLQVVGSGPDFGRTIQVSTSLVCKSEAIGILPLKRDVVLENGIEYIKNYEPRRV